MATWWWGGQTTNNAAYHAFRWTQAGGMADLGTLGGTNSYATAISADGNVVVGYAQTTANDPARHAFRWTQTGGMADLRTLGGTNSYATAVSSNGYVVVGYAEIADNQAPRAFRWTQAGGMANLGTLGGMTSIAYAVSADGNAVVGEADTATNELRAFRWTPAGGMANLGTLGGTSSDASAVSADGNVVVGGARTTNGVLHAFRWTQAGGMADLGTMAGGTNSYANAVSADGNVVVGRAYLANNTASRAFRWTQAGGMQSVEQWLAANGVTVAPSLVTKDATATNANGNAVVGRLENDNAFYARVGPLRSGLIDPEDLNRTLQGASHIPTQAIAQADLVLNGLNGSPLRGLPAAGRYNAWVSGDWGRQQNVAGDGNLGAGEFGVGWGLSEAVRVKLAVGRTHSAQGLAYDGDASVRGTYVVPEIVAGLAGTQLYLTLSGYYNAGDADIKRGYQNAGTAVTSDGSPDTATTGARLRLDWLDALQAGDLRLTPYFSFSSYRGHVNGYTETGGGFPVSWDARTERTSLGRLGADAAYPVADRWTLLGKIEGVYRFDSQSSGASGTILDLGNFTTNGLDYKQNWLRANIGVEGAVGPGVAAVLLNASTETNGPSYWAYASYRLDF